MDAMTDQPRRPDPLQPADSLARALARSLLSLGHAALAWEDPDTGTPGISRIAFARDPEAGLLTLVSGLAPHFRSLRDRPDCALMLGEVGEKGDPLTHPRLMIRARAAFVAADDPARPKIRARWLERTPKAQVYIDLPDFAFVRLTPVSALLNGGFARAFRLAPEDL
jgi:putative heme iron utilization protein